MTSTEVPRGRRRPAVVDAPSNLGLRPPVEGTVPGCYKLAGALRDCGVVRRLGAEDAGCVTPPTSAPRRARTSPWRPGAARRT
jgi:arginase